MSKLESSRPELSPQEIGKLAYDGIQAFDRTIRLIPEFTAVTAQLWLDMVDPQCETPYPGIRLRDGLGNHSISLPVGDGILTIQRANYKEGVGHTNGGSTSFRIERMITYDQLYEIGTPVFLSSRVELDVNMKPVSFNDGKIAVTTRDGDAIAPHDTPRMIPKLLPALFTP